MKIILTVTNDIASDQRLHRSALALLRMGYNVEIAGRLLIDSPALQRPYACRRFRLWFNKGPMFYANYNIRLFFFLISKRLDGILANDLDTLPAAFLAAKLRRKPILYDSHEYFPEVPELAHRPVIQKIWYLIEGTFVPRLPLMITVSHSIAAIYKEKYRIPVHTVRNLPLRSLQKDVKQKPSVALPQHNKVLIYQGAVNKGRGLEEMLQAMQLLEGVTLLIAGKGDLSERIASLIREYHLRDKVLQLGRLEPGKLRMLTARADGGISLERDMGLSYRYALPNKLFDYIQAEIPVLVSELPEMHKIVENWQIGLITPDHNPETLAEKVKQLLFDEKKRTFWKKNLRKASQHFTWKHEAQKLSTLFSDVFNKNGS